MSDSTHAHSSSDARSGDAPQAADAPQTALGQFYWHEIMTPDMDATRDFYTKLVGWKTMVGEAGDQPYEMWMNGEMPVGGLMGLPAPNVPPFWLAYISTPDVDGTVAKAEAHGATVYNRFEVDGVGRFAVVSDPQGAAFSLIEPATYMPVDGPPAVREFSWHELSTTDWEAGWDFYRAVFGWKATGQMDMGEAGIYHMFKGDAHELGGMMNAPKGAPTGWLMYIRVPDVRAAVETVKESGGTVLNGPQEVPGGDLIAQCMDPQGIPFALHSAVGDAA